MRDREVEPVDSAVVADTTFVERASVQEDVGLPDLTRAEAVEDRLGDRAPAVGDR